MKKIDINLKTLAIIIFTIAIIKTILNYTIIIPLISDHFPNFKTAKIFYMINLFFDDLFYIILFRQILDRTKIYYKKIFLTLTMSTVILQLLTIIFFKQYALLFMIINLGIVIVGYFSTLKIVETYNDLETLGENTSTINKELEDNEENSKNIFDNETKKEEDSK